MTSLKNNPPFLFGLLTGLFVVDRILKRLAAKNFTTEEFTLIPGALKFEFFANKGIAFSIPFEGPVLWILSTMIIGAFSYFAFKHLFKKHPFLVFIYLLFIFGAISNLYDRILLGHVIDYFIFFNRSAVNIADGMIIAGAGFLIFHSHTPRITDKREAPLA